MGKIKFKIFGAKFDIPFRSHPIRHDLKRKKTIRKIKSKILFKFKKYIEPLLGMRFLEPNSGTSRFLTYFMVIFTVRITKNGNRTITNAVKPTNPIITTSTTQSK